jgi:hypothetical protein
MGLQDLFEGNTAHRTRHILLCHTHEELSIGLSTQHVNTSTRHSQAEVILVLRTQGIILYPRVNEYCKDSSTSTRYRCYCMSGSKDGTCYKYLVL